MNIRSAKFMAPSSVVLHDDLIAELLSFLPVKYLLRFRCVSKSWKTLISDNAFVKLHLKRSATQNPHFIIITEHMVRLKEDLEGDYTYKVVAFRYNHIQLRSDVKILNFGDNVWRDIESFPVDPLDVDCIGGIYCPEKGVYLSDTLNWLAIHNNLHYNFKDITVGQFVIVSLDLRTETYNEYMLPHGFDEVPWVEPTVGVLGGCLCFSYFYMKIDFEFVIWQMKKFGVEESWTQLFKVSYPVPSVELGYTADDQIIPLLVTEDGRVLFKYNIMGDRTASLYNWRDNREEKIEFTASRPITNNSITREEVRWEWAMDYVETLVSII